MAQPHCTHVRKVAIKYVYTEIEMKYGIFIYLLIYSLIFIYYLFIYHLYLFTDTQFPFLSMKSELKENQF